MWTENKSVFYPGERVSGLVVLYLKRDVKLRSLRIFLRGVAKVHWTESRNTGTRLGSYTEHYNAEVEYFFKRQVLFGGGIYTDREINIQIELVKVYINIINGLHVHVVNEL